MEFLFTARGNTGEKQVLEGAFFGESSVLGTLSLKGMLVIQVEVWSGLFDLGVWGFRGLI